jgi:hypothetical protein
LTEKAGKQVFFGLLAFPCVHLRTLFLFRRGDSRELSRRRMMTNQFPAAAAPSLASIENLAGIAEDMANAAMPKTDEDVNAALRSRLGKDVDITALRSIARRLAEI